MRKRKTRTRLSTPDEQAYMKQMQASEQLAWCQREHATVWFGKNRITLKVGDIKHAITAPSLPEAIAHVETVRQERKEIAASLTSLANKPPVGAILVAVAGKFLLNFIGLSAVDVFLKLVGGMVEIRHHSEETRALRAKNNLLHVDENKVVVLRPGGHIDVIPVLAGPSPNKVTVVEEREEQKALPAPEVPTGRELLQSGKVTRELAQGSYLLGFGEQGAPIRISCKKLFSTLIAGVPRTGKTTTVFWVTTQLLLRGGKFFVIDPNMHYESEEGDRGLAAELEDLSDFMIFPACEGSRQELLDRMRYMYRALCQRKQHGYIVKDSDAILAIMDEFNSVAQVLSPKTVVVVHEEEELNFAQTLALLEREGPKYGLCFMLIGHKWTKDDIGGDNAVRTNATTYLCHKMNDARQAELLLKGKSQKILELPVGAYLATGPQFQEHATKIYTPMISARDIPVIRGLLGTSTGRPDGVHRASVKLDRRGERT